MMISRNSRRGRRWLSRGAEHVAEDLEKSGETGGSEAGEAGAGFGDAKRSRPSTPAPCDAAESAVVHGGAKRVRGHRHRE